MVVNPPYESPEAFILKMEATKEADDSTKALLIIPEFKHLRWFKDLLKRNKWRILWRFPRGSQLFSRPDK